MKAEIHPKWYDEAVVTCQCGNTWKTGATVPEIRTEICSNCHPFYTGEQRIVDTEGRVDKFLKRLQRRDERSVVEVAKPADPMAVAVTELKLKKATEAALKQNGLNTIADVVRAFEQGGDEAVAALDGMGQQALIDLKKGLRGFGVELPSA